MKKAKRIVSLVIALALVLSVVFTLAACQTECEKNGHKFEAGVCTVCGEKDPDYVEHVCDFGVSGVCSCGKVDPTAVYTQRSTMTLGPTTWNPFTYQSTNDSLVLDYTTAGFYAYDYIDVTDPAQGFTLIPSMANADPVDVTSQYVGEKWGIAEGETGRAFKIALKEDLCFEDGTPITAQTYVESFKRLLDPTMANSRASNYYTSSPSIVGAKAYAQGGWDKWMTFDMVLDSYVADHDSKIIFSMVGTGYNYDPADATKVIVSAGRSEIESNFDGDISGVAPEAVYNALIKAYETGAKAFAEGEILALEGKTIAEIKADPALKATLDNLCTFWAWYYGLANPEDAILLCTVVHWTFPLQEMSSVGVQAIDDHTLVIIYDAELVGFYIKYTLGLPLVHIEKYDASIKTDPTTGAKSSSYGTTVESYVGCSYGPYKLTEYVSGQKIIFERNEKYFAYQANYADEYGTIEVDGVTYRQYQTDRVEITQVPEIDTREQMFLAGQIDALGLNRALLDKYNGSDLIYTEGYSTFYGIINGNYEALRAREIAMNNKDEASRKYVNTILAVKEFRQALSYAIDREELIRVLYPAGTAAFGLYSDGIVADPLNGKSYHDFDEAKEAICRVWGIEYGPDKTFKTLDEAYKAIKGYDLEKAKELVDIAVDKAIALKYMDENSIVRIYHNESSDSATAKLWHSTFEEWFLELVEGTKLEGKFEYLYDTSLGENFGTSIRNGIADCAWGFGWNGSALDPWGLAEVYVDAAHDGSYQYDPYNNFAEIYPEVTLAIDFGEGEKDYTFNLDEWWAISVGVSESAQTGKELPNGAFGKIADKYRAKILAKIEECVLLEYCTIPIMNEGSVQLNSYKVRYYDLDNYIYGVGYGGLRYMTYNYTDAAWEAFVTEQGGTLDY